MLVTEFVVLLFVVIEYTTKLVVIADVKLLELLEMLDLLELLAVLLVLVPGAVEQAIKATKEIATVDAKMNLKATFI
jgi:hypothetical protein